MAELNPDIAQDTPINQFRLTQTRVDVDGVKVEIVKVRESIETIKTLAPREYVSGGFLIKIYSEPISDLLGWLVTEKRPIAGPTIDSYRINERGDLETIEKTVVQTGTPADADALLVTQSSVTNESLERSTKVTATVASHATLTGKRLNERGDIETFTDDIVAAGTDPYADGLLVTETKVEPLSKTKSKKTKATVSSHSTLTSEVRNERGDKVTVTDDIVAPDTDPEALSTTVESSEVKAVSKTKSRKVTATSETPSTLTTTRLNERGDVETVTDQVVSPTTVADADALLTTESKVEAINKGRSKKIKATVTAHSTLTSEVRNERGDKVTITDDIVASGTDPDALSTTVESSEVRALTKEKSKKVTATSETPSVLSSTRVNERGDLETVTDAIVAAGTEADPDALLTTESKVEAVNKGKSKKIKATVPSHSTLTTKRVNDRGDLETVTDDIVAAGSSPDADGLLVTKTEVQDYSKTKAKKIKATVTEHSTLTGKRLNERGDVETFTDDIVAAGTNPDADGLLVTETKVEPMSKTKSKKTKATVASHSTLTSEVRNERGDKVTVTDDIVTPDTDPEALSTTVESSEVKAVSKTKSRKVTATSETPSVLSSTRVNERGDLETVTDAIVAAGTEADPDALLTTQSKVEAVNKGRSKKIKATVPSHSTLTGYEVSEQAQGEIVTVTDDIVSPTATVTGGYLVVDAALQPMSKTKSKKVVKTVEEWPELSEIQVDEQTKIIIEVKKKIVPIADATPANSGYVDGWYVEFKPVDKWKAVRIKSRIPPDTLPDPVVYYGSTTLELPDTLLSIEPVWDNATNTGEGYGSGTAVKASASTANYISGEILVTVKHGYRGPVKARFTKSYLSAPPDYASLPEPFVWEPSYGTAAITAIGGGKNAQASASPSGTEESYSVGSKVSTGVAQIGPVLTAAIDSVTEEIADPVTATATASASGLEFTGTATATSESLAAAKLHVKMPASTPTAIPYGEWILKEIQVEQWRLGVWVVLQVEALIPEA